MTRYDKCDHYEGEAENKEFAAKKKSSPTPYTEKKINIIKKNHQQKEDNVYHLDGSICKSDLSLSPQTVCVIKHNSCMIL